MAAHDWIEHLTDEERERLAQITAEKAALTAERRKLYERAYKRMNRA